MTDEVHLITKMDFLLPADAELLYNPTCKNDIYYQMLRTHGIAKKAAFGNDKDLCNRIQEILEKDPETATIPLLGGRTTYIRSQSDKEVTYHQENFDRDNSRAMARLIDSIVHIIHFATANQIAYNTFTRDLSSFEESTLNIYQKLTTSSRMLGEEQPNTVFEISMTYWNSSLFIKLTVPLYDEETILYRIHTLPTFYQFQNYTIATEISPKSPYAAINTGGIAIYM